MRKIETNDNVSALSVNPWRFSSEYADEVSGTVYYNYRHYEPMAGRWMQRDPIEELYPNIVVGIVDCYLAVLNNPIKLFDLRGLDNPGCDVVGIIPGWDSMKVRWWCYG